MFGGCGRCEGEDSDFLGNEVEFVKGIVGVKLYLSVIHFPNEGIISIERRGFLREELEFGLQLLFLIVSGDFCVSARDSVAAEKKEEFVAIVEILFLEFFVRFGEDAVGV